MPRMAPPNNPFSDAPYLQIATTDRLLCYPWWFRLTLLGTTRLLFWLQLGQVFALRSP